MKLTEEAASSLMDLRVLISSPPHMSNVGVAPMMHAVPQYRMLTGNMANNWNGFITKNTFTVGDISSDFNSIQACLNAVPAGSFIAVHPGVYNESITITKSVTLMASGGLSSTFLTTTVIISASCVTLNGFTFKGTSRNQTILKIEGIRIRIQNCKFIGQYMVNQPIDQHNVELAISCHGCRNVKIFNNIFFHCMFALQLNNSKRFTIRSNVFSYGYTSMVVQQSTNIYAFGNMFESNRAIVWLDRGSEASVLSLADNIYNNNLESDICQYQNQIMHNQKIYFTSKFGELKDTQCHCMNTLSTANGTSKVQKDVMTQPDHVVFKGWCGNQLDKKQATDTSVIEGQLYIPSGCILLLGSVSTTVNPQGTDN